MIATVCGQLSISAIKYFSIGLGRIKNEILMFVCGRAAQKEKFRFLKQNI